VGGAGRVGDCVVGRRVGGCDGVSVGRLEGGALDVGLGEAEGWCVGKNTTSGRVGVVDSPSVAGAKVGLIREVKGGLVGPEATAGDGAAVVAVPGGVVGVATVAVAVKLWSVSATPRFEHSVGTFGHVTNTGPGHCRSWTDALGHVKESSRG
jgi:hypothetical protein